MDFRERLLKNEVRHLTDDLKALSQELLILQDFIKLQFGQKYSSYYNSRSIGIGIGDDERITETEIENAYILPEKGSYQKEPKIVKVKGSQRDQETSRAKKSARGRDVPPPVYQEESSSIDNVDDEECIIFDALEDSDNDSGESRKQTDNEEDPTSSQVIQRRNKREKACEEFDPDFDPLEFSGIKIESTDQNDCDSNDAEGNQMQQNPNKRIRRTLQYEKLREYDSLEEARADAKAAKFEVSSCTEDFKGTKVRYRCRVGSRRKGSERINCTRCVYLFVPKNKGKKIEWWETPEPHICNPDAREKDRGLPKDIQLMITQIFGEGIQTAYHVMSTLNDRGIDTKERKLKDQIYSFLRQLRKKHDVTIDTESPSCKRSRGRPKLEESQKAHSRVKLSSLLSTAKNQNSVQNFQKEMPESNSEIHHSVIGSHHGHSLQNNDSTTSFHTDILYS